MPLILLLGMENHGVSWEQIQQLTVLLSEQMVLWILLQWMKPQTLYFVGGSFLSADGPIILPLGMDFRGFRMVFNLVIPLSQSKSTLPMITLLGVNLRHLPRDFVYPTLCKVILLPNVWKFLIDFFFCTFFDRSSYNPTNPTNPTTNSSIKPSIKRTIQDKISVDSHFFFYVLLLLLRSFE